MKNNFSLILSISQLLFLLTACASLHEQAEDYYHSGSYDQAMELYSNILERDSEDKKAQVGLKRAHDGWISQRLLQVRRYRIAKNFKVEFPRKSGDFFKQQNF